jgi:hypothetical protein
LDGFYTCHHHLITTAATTVATISQQQKSRCFKIMEEDSDEEWNELMKFDIHEEGGPSVKLQRTKT